MDEFNFNLKEDVTGRFITNLICVVQRRPSSAFRLPTFERKKTPYFRKEKKGVIKPLFARLSDCDASIFANILRQLIDCMNAIQNIRFSFQISINFFFVKPKPCCGGQFARPIKPEFFILLFLALIDNGIVILVLCFFS